MQGSLQLQSAYENAKARGAELAALSKSSPPHLRAQLLQASKTYHAISTVIFASICINQIGDLENFIETSSQSLPSSLFEAAEWNSAINAAESARTAAGAGKPQLIQASIMDCDVSSEGASKIAEMQKSLALLSKDVSAEITNMGTSLSLFKSQLIPLLKKETQRYAELQAKFNEIDDIHANALRTLRVESDEKIMKEIAAKAQVEEKLDDIKYSLESEIDSLKEKINSLENTNQQKMVVTQAKTIEELESKVFQLEAQADTNASLHTQTVAKLEDERNSLKKKLAAKEAEFEQNKKEFATKLEAADVGLTAQMEKMKKDAELLASQVAAESAAYRYEIDALRESLEQERASSATTRERAVKMEMQFATHDLATKIVFDSELAVQNQQLALQKKTADELKLDLENTRAKLIEAVQEEENLAATNAKLSQDILVERDIENQLRLNAEALQRDLDSARNKLLRKGNELELAAQVELKGQIEELQNALIVAKEKLTAVTAEEDTLKAMNEKLQSKVESELDVENSLNSNIGELNGEVGDLRRQLSDRQRDCDYLKKNMEKNSSVLAKIEQIFRADKQFMAKEPDEPLDIRVKRIVNELIMLKKKFANEKESMDAEHLKALEQLRQSLEGGAAVAPGTSHSLSRAKTMPNGEIVHHHVMFADLKSTPDESPQDPLIQRIIADVKVLKEHALDADTANENLVGKLHETEHQLQEEIEKEKSLEHQLEEEKLKEKELEHQLEEEKEKEKDLESQLVVEKAKEKILELQLVEEMVKEKTLEESLVNSETKLSHEIVKEKFLESFLSTTESKLGVELGKEDALAKKIKDLEAKLKDALDTKENMNSRKLELERKVSDSLAESKDFQAKVDALNASIKSLQEQNAVCADSLVAANKQNDEAAETIQKLKAEAGEEKVRRESELAGIKQELQTSIDTLTADLNQAKEALAKEQSERLIADEQITQLKATVEELQPVNPEGADGVPEIVKPYIAEIEGLEQEIKNLKESMEGLSISVQGKNEELLRIILNLKTTVDERDNQIQSLSKSVSLKSRNAADAEAMELRLLQEVAEVSAERDAAIKACDILKNHINTLAKELGGAQALVPEIDATSAVEVGKVRLLAHENSATFLEAQITKLNETLAFLPSKMPPAEPAEAAASQSEGTAGVGSNLNDPQLYLVTIEDLREQIAVNISTLQSELDKRQEDLLIARNSQQQLEKQVEELRNQRQSQIDSSMKTITSLVISKLAVATATQAETVAMVKKSNAAKDQQYENTIQDLENELVVAKRDLEKARSRPGTADQSAAPSTARTPATAGPEPQTTAAPYATPAGESSEPEVFFNTMESNDPDVICTPSLFLPKIGARKKRAASPSPQRSSAVDLGASTTPGTLRPLSGSNRPISATRPKTPNLDEELQKFYSTQKKLAEPSAESINRVKQMREEFATTAEAEANLSQPVESTTEIVPMTIEEVDKYCDAEIAKESEDEKRIRQSVADKDQEIKDLRMELHSSTQALNAVRGELVVKMMVLAETEQQVARLQADAAEFKFILSKAEEKVHNIEYRRDQCEYQKSLVEEKLNEYMKMARKAADTESQLFDAARKLKQTSVELEKNKLTLREAIFNANALYRVKILGVDPKLNERVAKFQAVIRGGQSRARTNDLFIQKVATELGTLIAKDGTQQGESGWYAGPDGSNYYFIHDRGNWTVTSGPYTNAQYRRLLECVRVRDKASHQQMLTPFPGKIAVSLPKDGRVFVDNKSKKLVVVTPLNLIGDKK